MRIQKATSHVCDSAFNFEILKRLAVVHGLIRVINFKHLLLLNCSEQIHGDSLLSPIKVHGLKAYTLRHASLIVFSQTLGWIDIFVSSGDLDQYL